MPRPKPTPTIPFTLEAFDKIKLDYQRLKKEREEVMERLKTAREMGDLSENGAYKYAKFELGNISRQLHQLRHLLDYGYIKQASKDQHTVDFGSKVKLQDKSGIMEFLMVSAHESDITMNKLSMDSPLGKALMDKTVGDTITVDTPSGIITYTILNIS